jgi:Flp pilus assembly pilin Flp
MNPFKVPLAGQRKAVAAGATAGLATGVLGGLAGLLHLFGAFLPAPVTLVLTGVVTVGTWLVTFWTKKNAAPTSS